MKLMLLSIVLCTFAIHGSAQEYTDKYKNGNIKIHGYYNEDTGEEEGHWIWYNEDGTKAEECDYVNGKREGLLKTYVRGKLV